MTKFSDKTLADLEWTRFLGHLAARCTGAEAAEACERFSFKEPDDAWRHMALVDELCVCIRAGDLPPELPALPTGEALAHIRSDGEVPGEALRAISVNLKLFGAVARYLDNRRDVCPKNAAVLLPPHADISVLSLTRLAAEIDSVFEPDGTISDTASPELGRLRKRTISLRENLLRRIDAIAEAESDLLQDRVVTVRNDRLVLPVRTDAHRKLKGIVHGTSGTGATVFVEPQSVVEAGNELTLVREEMRREELKILAGLRSAVKDQLDAVTYACRAVVDTEVRIAAARVAVEINAQVPFRAEAGTMHLVKVRHPLLMLDNVKVIPSTVSVSAGNCLLISGPNAGGKTVLLKTVGIIGLMISAGLPVPVDAESQVGPPANILTDIGDDQSLELSLSTFSAHMKNIATILDDAMRGAVVLLDELASGTDPVEGTALAEAVMDRLNAFGVTTLATTHFDTLKVRAQETGGFTNVAMGFDAAAGGPTFELHVGVPGNSSAIAVATRYGIPASVIDKARTLLPEGARRLTEAVEHLEAEKVRLSKEREALVEQREDLARTAAKHAAELAHLKARQDKFVDKETDKLWAAIKDARQSVRDAERMVKRRRTDQATVKKSRDAINEVADKLSPGGNLNPAGADALPGRPAGVDDIKLGVAVYVTSLGAKAEVDSNIKGNTVYVRAGALRLRVTVDELRALDKKPAAQRDKTKKMPAPIGGLGPGDTIRTSNNTLNLRGKRVDEALDEADAYLDAAMRDGTDVVFLLHGHGTGALRDALRSYLKESRYVERSRPGTKPEGGDGITAVWLR